MHLLKMWTSAEQANKRSPGQEPRKLWATIIRAALNSLSREQYIEFTHLRSSPKHSQDIGMSAPLSAQALASYSLSH